ncbi:hypothetical protein L228DRAFT_269388 [Xylona heveae TC161]|uniref:WSC domain-containing protein n=1 Tax=Xylona heveae (strain CBS 132557 / TC161) TaxID=1328760 RepID=A0A165GA99_XYLHT|nr:hypothetical protein L228DRAFT_269388 [Xylona heveae TC161]KZF21944.1 hypothetical protein L228DRAFT_269388 [Xylona heveae TC161]
MKGQALLALLSAWSVCSVAAPADAQATASASPSLALKPTTYKGCFSSSNPLKDQGPYTYQSVGYCQKICVGLNMAVMGLAGGSNCWCGSQLPVANSKVSDSECNAGCYGYDQQDCGGSDSWSVYLTGTEGQVDNVAASSSSTSTSATPTSTSSSAPPATSTSRDPSTVTIGGPTMIVTISGHTSAVLATGTNEPKSSHSHGPNKAGIAVGVVVGIVVLASAAAGVFLLLRQRRRRAVEEQYRRNAANFPGGVKPESAFSLADSRLEPSVMNRRQSDGSIADNQDYSRRILKASHES